MDENTQKLIAERFKELPPEMQRAFTTINWLALSKDIGHKFGLHIDQVDALQRETMLLLLGLSNPTGLKDILAEQLEISDELAETLAEEVDADIIKPLREKIVASYHGEESEDTVEGEGALLSSLENPPTTKPVSFVEAKMQAPHSLKTTDGDDVPLPPEESGVDPYREEF